LKPVAKERLKSPRVRLFVALDLPQELREGITRWGEEQLTDPALRPVPTEALHVTLAFLGWCWEREIPRAAEIVHQVRAAAPRASLVPEPVAIPPRKREKRLFALDAPSEDTVALQRDLEAELVEAHLYKPEKRPFWSHVTVARVRKEKGKERGRYMRVRQPPGPLPEALLEPFFGVRVTLYLSVLRPAGAQYTPLAQVELPRDEAAMR
jgi:RNA 2',3'-cyclic 3'-phosphodiesterase